MMQCASCCEAVFPVSDNEVVCRELVQNAALTSIDTVQLPSDLHIPAPSSALFDEGDMMCCRSESHPHLLKPHPHRRNRRFLALVDLMINKESIALNLEAFTLPCAYEVGIPFDLIAQQARRYNDAMELRFALHVRYCSLKARNLFISLRFPWGTPHYLGPLAAQTGVASARFVRHVPSSLTLVVDVDYCIPAELDAPLPCEMLLKEHVKTILENDDFCGSIAAAHVQNLVRDLPFYEAAMRRFRTWSEYVMQFSAFYGCWVTVLYEEDEHAALGLSNLTPPGELRLVANCFADRYASADVHRDKIKWRALCDFRKRVAESSRASKTSLTGAPTIRLPRHTVRTLSSESSFRTLNSVNYLHVLEHLVKSRFVLFSELHPVQVDLCMLPNTSNELLLTVGGR